MLFYVPLQTFGLLKGFNLARWAAFIKPIKLIQLEVEIEKDVPEKGLCQSCLAGLEVGCV